MVMVVLSLGAFAETKSIYKEPKLNTVPDSTWNSISDDRLHLSWASRNKHYAINTLPLTEDVSTNTVSGWRGERVNTEAVVYSKKAHAGVQLRFAEWTKGSKPTGIKTAEANFLNYVITDDYKRCGNHDMELEPLLVPDIVFGATKDIEAMETRPVWCSIEIPRNIEAGTYQTQLELVDGCGRVVEALKLNIHVADRTLPEPKDQKFHLDLWQQPYSVSRYYGLDRWSDAHVAALRPFLRALGRAGQKVVSTIMFYEPWGDQSYDKFSAMVQSTLCKDGSWKYDYSIFDKYVNLCEECGISKQINCYSMVPWDMEFQYFDQAANSVVSKKLTTSDEEYKNIWKNFLCSFKKHLIEKGWFEKTHIAMDERAEKDMNNAYEIAKEYGFKMALAGNYHPSLIDKLEDYCLAPNQLENLKAEELQYRKDRNMITTFYTCCAELEPNIFSCSLPAEAAYLPLVAAANNLDGYLHWSWINWDNHPLTDSRFRLFGSGDTYNFYPGVRSSVRFERLTEGIQQYEKIQILLKELKGKELEKLQTLIDNCKDHSLAGEECAGKVEEMESFLNSH